MIKNIKTKSIAALTLIIISTAIIFKLRTSPAVEPVLSPDFRRTGDKNSAVRVFEFSDFACPACAMAHKKLNEIKKVYGKNVDINFKHYPLLEIHKNSLDAAAYADCAGKQGKFWELADFLFENQKTWAKSENLDQEIKKAAQNLSLDYEKLKACHMDGETLKNIKLDISMGEIKGIDATPTFFINGKRAVGSRQMINLLQIETSKIL